MPEILLPPGPFSLWRDAFGLLWRVAADGQSRVRVTEQVGYVDALSLQRRRLFHEVIDAPAGSLLAEWLDSVPQ